MANNKRIIFTLCCILTCALSYAQDVNEIKKEFNNIKKSPEYIYGQSSGEDEKKCYEIAYKDFLMQLNEFIAADETLRNAHAIIVDKMEKKVKKISFERHLNCKVVCVYINKNDIKPIQKDDIIDTTKVTVPVIINSVVENKTESTEEASVDVLQNQNLPVKSEKADSNTTPNHTATVNVGNAKDNEILNEVYSLGDAKKTLAYLNNRKSSNHDIVFKPTKAFGNITNAYWLVFDNSNTLIAILTKDKTLNILTNTPVKGSEYTNSPKIWLQIY